MNLYKFDSTLGHSLEIMAPRKTTSTADTPQVSNIDKPKKGKGKKPVKEPAVPTRQSRRVQESKEAALLSKTGSASHSAPKEVSSTSGSTSVASEPTEEEVLAIHVPVTSTTDGNTLASGEEREYQSHFLFLNTPNLWLQYLFAILVGRKVTSGSSTLGSSSRARTASRRSAPVPSQIASIGVSKPTSQSPGTGSDIVVSENWQQKSAPLSGPDNQPKETVLSNPSSSGSVSGHSNTPGPDIINISSTADVAMTKNGSSSDSQVGKSMLMIHFYEFQPHKFN